MKGGSPPHQGAQRELRRSHLQVRPSPGALQPPPEDLRPMAKSTSPSASQLTQPSVPLARMLKSSRALAPPSRGLSMTSWKEQ